MSKTLPVQPSSSSEPPTRLTYEQFLEWADEDTLAEWIDGAIVMTSPASLRHQDIINFLVGLLSTFTTVHSLGHIVDGPFQMKLERSGREPDVLYVAKAHLGRLKTTYLDGPADLVVEVVSPESAGRDRGDKFYEYRQAGIPEYWLIDPVLEQAEFYQLDKAKRYQLIAPDKKSIYRSKVLPGFWLRVGWLWQEPLPDVVKALLEIDRAAYARYLQEQLKQAGL